MVLYFLPLNKSDDKSGMEIRKWTCFLGQIILFLCLTAVSKKDISIVDEDLSVHSYDFVFKDELDQIHNEDNFGKFLVFML